MNMEPKKRLVAAGFIRRDPLDPAFTEVKLETEQCSYYTAWKTEQDGEKTRSAKLDQLFKKAAERSS